MRPRLRTSGLERIAPVDASSWYTGACKDTHRPHRRGVFLPCYTSDVPGGGVPEETTQLFSPNLSQPIFHWPKSFCYSKNYFIYAQSILRHCFYKGKFAHIYAMIFFFFIEIRGVIQYIQIQHWRDVFLKGVGDACSDLPLLRDTVSLLSLLRFTHVLILFQSQFHKGRWQSATWDICPSESDYIFGPEQAVWGPGQPRAKPWVFLPSH